MAAQQVPDDWRINVKALMETGSEKTYRVTMPSTETIGVLRNNIATKSQVEAQKQRLIFCGRLLSNDAQTLVEVGMSDDCALHMVASRAPNSTGTTPNPGARPPQQQQQQQPDQPHPEFLRLISNMMGRPLERGMMFQHSHLTDSPEEGGDGHTRRAFDHTGSPPSPLPGNYPVNESSPAEAFQPIPGLSPIPQGANIQMPVTSVYVAHSQLQDMSEPERLPPTVAQANELIYDLFTHVLPSIRRHPEREAFHFSTTESTSPTFIAPTTGSQIGGAGGALVNLGDAFSELGRSLREVGQEWQAHNSTAAATTSGSAATRNGYSPAQIQAVLLTLTQLLRVSPLAVPFLQSTIARTSGNEGQTLVNNNNTTDPTPADNGYRDAMDRRVRRHNALVNLVVDTNRAQGRNNASANPFNGAFGNVGVSFMPPIFIEPTFSEHPQSRTSNPDRNPNAGRSPAPGGGSSTNSDGNANAGRNAAPGERSSITNSTGSSGTTRIVHRTIRSIGGSHVIEAIIQQMGAPEHQSSVNTASAQARPPLNVQTSQLNQQQQQQRQQNERNPQAEIHIGNGSYLPESAANSTYDFETTTPTSADGGNGFYSFLERLRTLGNRNTAQSDRSNASTTTEYSTGNGVSSVRTQRTFTINGGTLGSPLMQQAPAMNPFPSASIFLGVEPGSTRNTSRRTSLSSNVGGGNDPPTGSTEARATANVSSIAVGNSAQAAGGSGMENVSAVASSSNGAVEPRRGETRPRGSSSCTSDTNHGEGPSTNRSNHGSSKRHKAGDVGDGNTSN